MDQLKMKKKLSRLSISPSFPFNHLKPGLVFTAGDTFRRGRG
jgi:hypothetical protein